MLRPAQWIATASAICAYLIVSTPIFAQTNNSQKLDPQLSHAKISRALLAAVQPDGKATVERRARANSTVNIDDKGRAHVFLYAEMTASRLDILRSLGASIEIVQPATKTTQARVPLDRLRAIAQLDFIESMRPADRAVVFTGSVTTEGDTLLGAQQVRSANDVDGDGVRIGVISDGVDSRQQAQFTLDLPNAIDINPALPGGGDEGTAMLEIIHDLAAGAQLAFSSAQTSVEMVEAIDYLTNDAFAGAGCQVIVDDLGFLSQPMFEDGPIADAVEQAVARGVTYITAVGNQATAHYESEYTPGLLTIDGQPRIVHDFGTAIGGGPDFGQEIFVPGGGSVTVILQWSDPFNNPLNDYDLIIMDQTLTRILAISEETQSGQSGQPPIEIATVENNTSSELRVSVVIRNLNAQARTLEMHYSGLFRLQEFNTPAGSIVPGQQSANGTISVGAINVNDPGADTIEPFSSIGPAAIHFPRREDRSKPDLVAVDGNLITGAGGFGSIFGNQRRFFGTSAAGPHVAGVAALLLERNPDLSPSQVRAALAGTAEDLGEPGQDFVYGAGLIDATRAFEVIGTETGSSSLELALSYPNPFDPAQHASVTVDFSNQELASVKLEILNTLGQRVETILNTEGLLVIGPGQAIWDGRNEDGRLMPSGIYFYRLTAGSKSKTRKLALIWGWASIQ